MYHTEMQVNKERNLKGRRCSECKYITVRGKESSFSGEKRKYGPF